MPEKLWACYCETYACADEASMWKAFDAMTSVFHLAGEEVANEIGAVFPVLLLILLAGCGYTAQDTKGRENMVITQEEAKEIMDAREDYVLLDVREKEEYAQGHIEGRCFCPMILWKSWRKRCCRTRTRPY